jgi:hypothetical protein
MAVTRVAVSAESGQKLLYVLMSNVAPFGSDVYQYGHVSSGRVRALAAEISPEGQLGEDVAIGEGMAFGSGGYSGAGEARLLRLGRDHHAWHFVSGGVWQGTVVNQHVLLARQGSSFKDVSAIPEVEESDQAHRYDIAVDASDLESSEFPLIVSKYPFDPSVRASNDSDQPVAQWTVGRDAASGLYRLPTGTSTENAQ